MDWWVWVVLAVVVIIVMVVRSGPQYGSEEGFAQLSASTMARAEQLYFRAKHDAQLSSDDLMGLADGVMDCIHTFYRLADRAGVKDSETAITGLHKLREYQDEIVRLSMLAERSEWRESAK